MGEKGNSGNSRGDPSLQNVMLDDRHFELFFKENFIPLCVYCRDKFGFTTDEAKEVVHTGFIKLWENRSIIPPASSAKAWLYTTIRNACLDILRHEKIRDHYRAQMQKEGLAGLSGSAPDIAAAQELRQTIERSVADLPEQMRKIFELSRYEGLKYSQIAERMGVSVKTVETQIRRALIKLRSKLRDFLLL